LHRISTKLVDFCNLAELWLFSEFPPQMWWFFGINHDGPGSLLGVLLMGLFALMHAFFAWVAVTEN
jgi:hypothetical protein